MQKWDPETLLSVQASLISWWISREGSSNPSAGGHIAC